MRRLLAPPLMLLCLLACTEKEAPAPATAPAAGAPAAQPSAQPTAQPSAPAAAAGTKAGAAPAPAQAPKAVEAPASKPVAAPAAAPAAPSPTPAPAPAVAIVSAPPPAPATSQAPAPKPAPTPAAGSMPSLAGNGHGAVGAGACKMCHRLQHDSWSATAHAKKGLDCEACHGNGADYKAMGVMKNLAAAKAAGLVLPTLDFCRKCHGAKADAALFARVHAHKG